MKRSSPTDSSRGSASLSTRSAVRLPGQRWCWPTWSASAGKVSWPAWRSRLTTTSAGSTAATVMTSKAARAAVLTGTPLTTSMSSSASTPRCGVQSLACRPARSDCPRVVCTTPMSRPHIGMSRSATDETWVSTVEGCARASTPRDSSRCRSSTEHPFQTSPATYVPCLTRWSTPLRTSRVIWLSDKPSARRSLRRRTRAAGPGRGGTVSDGRVASCSPPARCRRTSCRPARTCGQAMATCRPNFPLVARDFSRPAGGSPDIRGTHPARAQELH